MEKERGEKKNKHQFPTSLHHFTQPSPSRHMVTSLKFGFKAWYFSLKQVLEWSLMAIVGFLRSHHQAASSSARKIILLCGASLSRISRYRNIQTVPNS